MKRHNYESNCFYQIGDEKVKRYSHDAIYERVIKVLNVNIIITQVTPHGSWGCPEVPIYANGFLLGKMSKCIEGDDEWEFDALIKGDYCEYRYGLVNNRRNAFVKSCKYIELTAVRPDENEVDEWMSCFMKNIAQTEKQKITDSSNSEHDRENLLL